MSDVKKKANGEANISALLIGYASSGKVTGLRAGYMAPLPPKQPTGSK